MTKKIELNLTPVYYRTDLNSSVPFPSLFENHSPYAHQLQTYCAVARTQDYDRAISWCNNCELNSKCTVNKLESLPNYGTLCIINSAITGGGKTIASYAYGVENCSTSFKVLGVYPTNELLKDQKRAIIKLYRELHKKDSDSKFAKRVENDIVVIDANYLREHRVDGERNINFIRDLFTQSKIILTNPDILYLICHHLYASNRQTTGTNITAFSILMSSFKTIIFDEFHLYNIKQQSSILWLVGLSTQLNFNIESATPKAFIFSSATPLDNDSNLGRQLKYLEKLGIITINIHQQGDNYGRPVMEAVKLRLESANLAYWLGKDKALKLLPKIKEIVDRNINRKCLYVMDSVASARDIKKKLIDLYGQNLVGEVHGLVRKEAKESAFAKQHTTGTSGIEVGIDFVGDYFKDILLFEARNSAQFLQRLGRIGRNGRSNANNIAIAIVSPEVIANLREQKLTDGSTVNRVNLPDIAKIAFIWFDPERFNNYLDSYAPLEAEYTTQIYLRGFEYFYNKLTKEIQKSEERIIKENQLSELIINLYPGCDRLSLAKKLNSLFYRGTISGLLGFRNGGSVIEKNIYTIKNSTTRNIYQKIFQPLVNFTIPYFDAQEARDNNGFPFHRYSLNYLLRRTNCRFVTKEEFRKKFKDYEHYTEAKSYYQEMSQGQPMAYAIVYDDLDKPRHWYFYSQGKDFRYFTLDSKGIKLDNGIKLKQVVRVRGLSIQLERSEDSMNLEIINQTLKQRDAIVYINTGKAFKYVKDKKLPPLFELADFKFGASSAKYHIAFDLNAFMLDSLNYSSSTAIIT